MALNIITDRKSRDINAKNVVMCGLNKMVKKLKIPKFPVKAKPQSYEKWGKQVRQILLDAIEKDSKKMSIELAFYFDIRPIIEAL